MNAPNKNEWYKDLDISLKGKPTGIDRIDAMLSYGICYCIVSSDDVVEQVDVYEDGQKVHFKIFRYDSIGRVIENAMYSPDGAGNWNIIDDIWYYEYNPETGLRSKKVTRAPGGSKAQEILYNKYGEKVSEKTITVDD